MLYFKSLTNVQNEIRLTRGSLPGVGDEGGVVLDLVGEDGGAVVTPRLPDHHGVLAVALHPQQVGRVGHVLDDEAGRVSRLVQLREGLTCVAPRVQLRRLCNCQRVVVGLNETRLCLKVNASAVFEPVDDQL